MKLHRAFLDFWWTIASIREKFSQEVSLEFSAKIKNEYNRYCTSFISLPIFFFVFLNMTDSATLLSLSNALNYFDASDLYYSTMLRYHVSSSLHSCNFANYIRLHRIRHPEAYIINQCMYQLSLTLSVLPSARWSIAFIQKQKTSLADRSSGDVPRKKNIPSEVEVFSRKTSERVSVSLQPVDKMKS